MLKQMQVKGSELQVGDILHVWWNLECRGSVPNRDVITKLEDYKGPLSHLFSDGARLASFQFNRTGMTIENSAYYTIDRE